MNLKLERVSNVQTQQIFLPSFSDEVFEVFNGFVMPDGSVNYGRFDLAETTFHSLFKVLVHIKKSDRMSKILY